jgi:hypothetical protein
LTADSHQQPRSSASYARPGGAPASLARFLTVNRFAQPLRHIARYGVVYEDVFNIELLKDQQLRGAITA